MYCYLIQMLKPTGFNCPTYKALRKKAADAVEAVLMPKYADLVEFLRPIVQKNLDKPQKLRLRNITKLVDIQREVGCFASKGHELYE